MQLPSTRQSLPVGYLKTARSLLLGVTSSPIVWRNVLLLGGLHLLALGAFYSFLHIHWYTLIFIYGPTLLASLLGITAGAHRLWSHRAYKARLPLRVFLMLCNTIALQNDIYIWCRDHRAHHKFSESSADPHDSRRGFFFAHIGWLLVRKHADVKMKGATIDLTDLEQDPVVMFQHHYYKRLIFLLWFALPTLLPVFLWSESPVHAFLTCVAFRYVFTLHSTWLVNSAAHLYGVQPYDARHRARENQLVVFASFGEGYHNYHHTFPSDYATSEWGPLEAFNLTTAVIDLCAWMGQVEERKSVAKETIRNRIARTGDGAKYGRQAVVHQLVGAILGTIALWLPAGCRILFNYTTNRRLFA